MTGGRNCKAILFRCFDFRFRRAIGQWMDEQGYADSYDEVSVAGATKSLVQPFSFADTAFLIKQIEIAVMLHHVSDVILMHHEDCGAYGGKKAFSSDAEEFSFHSQEMKSAAGKIQKAFPCLNVIQVIAMIPDGELDRIQFEVVGESWGEAASNGKHQNHPSWLAGPVISGID